MRIITLVAALLSITSTDAEARITQPAPLVSIETHDAFFENLRKHCGKAFEGKGMLQQHRLVYQVLGDRMEKIHALSMKTFTPAEWASQPHH